MKGNSNRSRPELMLEGIYRRFFIRVVSNKKNSFLVTEFPKSGGSWLTKMLAELMDLDFPQNRFPMARASAFQGHYLHSFGQKNVIVLWRDPRDIIISWYFHSVIGNDHTNEAFVNSVRSACGITNPEKVHENLEVFIRYCFSGKMSPRFTWNDFFDKWSVNKEVIFTTYESLRHDPENELFSILKKMNVNVSKGKLADVVSNHSFERLSGRKAGQEDAASFVRKGIVGDWENYFDNNAAELFNECVGDRLSNLGYGDGKLKPSCYWR